MFIPSPNLKKIEIEVFGKNESDGIWEEYVVSEILVNGNSILTDNIADSNPKYLSKDKIENFQNGLALQYGLPGDLITWSYIDNYHPNVSVKLERSLKII